ncbi:MAG: S46 family peptidase [Bacteroidetes bacterium]|nr:S46 family peptidase [Bacteroidota bacterium]MBU1719850.1 S46 family peptidase [Bacteroidota bacterium]
MKKGLLHYILAVVFIIAGLLPVKADEGMWLPLLVNRLNYEDMQKAGLKLTPEEIYSVNNASLKDAIVKFGRGCSGSIVSKDGLLITAHHCSVDYIQLNSSFDADYLTNGFWSRSREEELPNPGLTVTFLVKIEDVTQRILKEMNENMTESSRKAKIQQMNNEISKEATDGTHYTAEVKGFFEDTEFYLFVYEVFRDVRLVAAPPQSLGNYGGDTDNWTWPRHTCDFSFFRVYTGPDGKPADYSPENIPLKPKHFLPISLKGVKQDDFTMTIGYPARTDRYLTSTGVDQLMKDINPEKVKIRTEKLAIMKADMNESDAVRMKYEGKYQRTSNYWKYWIGQTKQLEKNNVFNKKKAIEDAFDKWVSFDPKRKKKYGTVIEDLNRAYSKLRKFNNFKVYDVEVFRRGTDLVALAYRFNDLFNSLQMADSKDYEALVSESLREEVRTHFKTFNYQTDKKLFASLFKMAYENIPVDQHPDVFARVDAQFRGNFDAFADEVYSTTIFANGSKMWNFLKKPDPRILEKDLVFKVMQSCLKQNDKIDGMMIEDNWNLSKAKRLLVEGFREMKPDKNFYPDANWSMRISYGKISGYIPADGLIAKYYTTLDGVMQKEDPLNEEFIVPEEVKAMYRNKDYGRYAENGVLRVGFVSSNDVTGGSSGCPIINGNGELIGVVFDLNWEAMSADIAFEPEFQRTISADIRYILFVADKIGKAENILNEITIVE